MDTVLFGFDLVALFASLLKLAQEGFSLSARLVKIIGALLVAIAIVVVGLQGEGIILGPETEQWVVLGLTALSAALASLGFGPGLVGTSLAVVDTVRLSAAKRRAGSIIMAADKGTADETYNKLKSVLARYNADGLL